MIFHRCKEILLAKAFDFLALGFWEPCLLNSEYVIQDNAIELNLTQSQVILILNTCVIPKDT